MALISTILLFMLFVMNYKIGRGLFFPSTLFTGVWTLTLFALSISGDCYYSISIETYLIYIVGATAFSLGGMLIVWLYPAIQNTNALTEQFQYSAGKIFRQRTIGLLLIVLMIGFPFYWQYIINGVAFGSGDIMLGQIRAKVVESSGKISHFSVINNFSIIAQFVALVAVYESDGSIRHRLRSVLAIILAVLYGSATGAKGGAVVLFLQLFILFSLKYNKIRWRLFSLTVCFGGVFFMTGLYWVNFGYLNLKLNSETISMLIGTIWTYWLGGIVAFDRVVQNPNAIPLTQSVYRFFIETAQNLNFNVIVPSLHAEYTKISPYKETNVYTFYFTYFTEFGWAGMVLFLTALGAGLAWLHHCLRRQNPIIIIFYSWLCVGVVFSFFSDYFFLKLNGHIKLMLFLVFFYHDFVIRNQGKKRDGSYA